MKRINNEVLNYKQYSREEYGEALYEASFSRVWQHSKKGFFIISAFRGNDIKKNMQNHVKLKSILKSKNLGFFELDGVYTYEDGTTESELSLFVPYRNIYTFEEFKRLAIRLLKEFNQQAILLKYPEDMSSNIVLLYDNGKEEVIGNKLGFDKVAKNYSKLRKGNNKNRSIIVDYMLEGVRRPQNHISALALTSEGVLF